MTKKIIKYSLIIMLLSMSLIFVPIATDFSNINQAKAEESGWWSTVNDGGLNQVGQAYGQSATADENNDIRIVAARIIRRVLELLGLISLIIIIFAGYRWMTAGGDEEKVTAAKKQLINGVIGLIIITAAFSIATYVFYQLQYAITGIQPITWSW